MGWQKKKKTEAAGKELWQSSQKYAILNVLLRWKAELLLLSVPVWPVYLFVWMPVFELHKWKYAIKQTKATSQRNL